MDEEGMIGLHFLVENLILNGRNLLLSRAITQKNLKK